jgi:antitoxin component YwqK of YwqJK toxin-antitoxin module
MGRIKNLKSIRIVILLGFGLWFTKVCGQTTVNENKLILENGIYFYKDEVFTGKAVSYFSNGQLKSLVSYQAGNFKQTGKAQEYFEENDFEKTKYKDTALISKCRIRIDESRKRSAFLVSDSLKLISEIQTFVAYKIGGEKKLTKLLDKSAEGKLKSKEEPLFNEYTDLQNKIKTNNLANANERVKISENEKIINSEQVKPFFIPAIKREYEVLNSKKNGSFKEFTKTGLLIQDGKYTDGMMNGEWTFYFDSGKLKAKGNFINGDGTDIGSTGVSRNGRSGKWIFYFENGKMSSEGNWLNGKLNGLYKEYYENGNLKIEGSALNDNWNGNYKEYYENGKTKIETAYVLGKLNGFYKEYYENGNLKIEGSALNGNWNGNYKEYYENGKIRIKEDFLNGKLVGKVFEYFQNGQLKIEGVAQEDGQTYKFVKRFNEDGSPYVSEWYSSEDEYTKSKNIFAYTKCDNYTCPRLKIWGKNGIYRWALCERNSDYLDISTDPKKYATAVWYIKINGVNQEFYTEYANVTFLPNNIQEALLKASEVALKIGNNPHYYKVSLNGFSEAINWLNK